MGTITFFRARGWMSFGLALLAVCVLAGVTQANPDLPDGWIRAGSAPTDYDMGVERTAAHGGKASGFLKSKIAKPAGFGTLMQMCQGEEFRGKRVRMSAWIKSENVTDWAGLWMRVDGAETSHPLAFDNMQSRPIKGSSEWKEYQVVLDVASEAKDIAFGVLLSGPGAVWLDEFRFETVDRSVPTTGPMMGGNLAANPMNLDFEQ